MTILQEVMKLLPIVQNWLKRQVFSKKYIFHQILLWTWGIQFWRQCGKISQKAKVFWLKFEKGWKVQKRRFFPQNSSSRRAKCSFEHPGGEFLKWSRKISTQWPQIIGKKISQNMFSPKVSNWHEQCTFDNPTEKCQQLVEKLPHNVGYRWGNLEKFRRKLFITKRYYSTIRQNAVSTKLQKLFCHMAWNDSLIVRKVKQPSVECFIGMCSYELKKFCFDNPAENFPTNSRKSTLNLQKWHEFSSPETFSTERSSGHEEQSFDNPAEKLILKTERSTLKVWKWRKT